MKTLLQKKFIISFAHLLFGLCFLSACGQDTSPPTTPTGGSTEPKQVTIQLKHDPSGNADLKWNAQSHELSVTLALHGLQVKTTHPAHIHSGSCSKPGATVYTLDNVVADADGNASVTTVIKDVANGIPANGWYINVHNGPEMTTPEQMMGITCGDISNPKAATTTDQSVTVTMAGTPEPNQSASGTAQLTLSATALTVNITLNGLVANSTHMAHIHDGNCHKQGKIAFTLKPIVADASGIGHSTTEIPLTSLTSLSDKRPLYINVHFGATMQDLKTQPGYDSIACGDVVGLY